MNVQIRNPEKKRILILFAAFFALPLSAADLPYPIVDTGQVRCYNDRTEIEYPKAGQHYFGQDAHYTGYEPAYRDNGNGTITDLNTQLMWTQNPGSKKTCKPRPSHQLPSHRVSTTPRNV